MQTFRNEPVTRRMQRRKHRGQVWGHHSRPSGNDGNLCFRNSSTGVGGKGKQASAISAARSCATAHHLFDRGIEEAFMESSSKQVEKDRQKERVPPSPQMQAGYAAWCAARHCRSERARGMQRLDTWSPMLVGTVDAREYWIRCWCDTEKVRLLCQKVGNGHCRGYLDHNTTWIALQRNCGRRKLFWPHPADRTRRNSSSPRSWEHDAGARWASRSMARNCFLNSSGMVRAS